MISNLGDKRFLFMHSFIFFFFCAHYMVRTILHSEVLTTLDRAVKKIKSLPSWSLHSREETNNKQIKKYRTYQKMINVNYYGEK